MDVCTQPVIYACAYAFADTDTLTFELPAGYRIEAAFPDEHVETFWPLHSRREPPPARITLRSYSSGATREPMTDLWKTNPCERRYAASHR